MRSKVYMAEVNTFKKNSRLISKKKYLTEAKQKQRYIDYNLSSSKL